MIQLPTTAINRSGVGMEEVRERVPQGMEVERNPTTTLLTAGLKTEDAWPTRALHLDSN